MFLSVHDVSKRFGEHVAVNRVSFDVDAGERVALVGPNGAGKSTTLYMVLGLADPDSGSVTLDGIDVHRNRSEVMTRVGFAAAYLGMHRPLKVGHIFEHYAALRSLDRAAATRAIARFGLGDLLDQRARALSSGQKTLVSVAVATLGEPPLVVLDEPTAYMDPEVAMRVRSGLLTLNEESDSAVLITSHNMTEVERLCDHVLFIANGEIRAAGTPTTLVKEHGHENLEDLWLALAAEDR